MADVIAAFWAEYGTLLVDGVWRLCREEEAEVP